MQTLRVMKTESLPSVVWFHRRHTASDKGPEAVWVILWGNSPVRSDLRLV